MFLFSQRNLQAFAGDGAVASGCRVFAQGGEFVDVHATSRQLYSPTLNEY